MSCKVTSTLLHPSHFTLHVRRILRRLALSLLTLLVLSGVSIASPLDDGLHAFNEGNYPLAHQFWKPLAEQGNSRAQYNLGLLYEQGLGVAQHLRTAMALYRAAAQQGDADAQYNLGLMYAEGKSVFKNRKRAAEWWQKAADQQHPKALFNLGVLYFYGNGVKRDKAMALQLWKRAAAMGNVHAGRALEQQTGD
jgi:TPR repeat protein